jgi:hypothetical protein
MSDREFAHLQPSPDHSLHAMLPADVAQAAEFRARRGPHLGCATFVRRFATADKDWPAAPTHA